MVGWVLREKERIDEDLRIFVDGRDERKFDLQLRKQANSTATIFCSCQVTYNDDFCVYFAISEPVIAAKVRIFYFHANLHVLEVGCSFLTVFPRIHCLKQTDLLFGQQVSASIGLCRLTEGTTKALVSINGPIEVQRKDELVSETTIDIYFRPVSGFTG